MIHYFLLVLTSCVCLVVCSGRVPPFQRPHENPYYHYSSPGASSCAPRPRFPPGANVTLPLPQAALDNITAYLQKYTQAPCTGGPHTPSSPSFSGSVLVGNQTYYLNLGCTDVTKPNSSTPTEDTVYRLASVSKLFAVKLLLEALESGKIRCLDDEVRQYIPDFIVPNTYDRSQPTWRQMASQQSGLPRDSPCSPIDCNVTTAQVLQRLAQQRLLAAPWTRPSYSNVAFSLLGHLVAEYVENSTYGNSLMNLTQRYGMNSTGYTFTPEILSRLAIAYTPLGIPMPPLPLQWDTPAGGLYSTAKDLSVWLRMYLDGYDSSANMRQMMQPLYLDGSGTGWSTPWELFPTQAEYGYIIRTKDGYLPGITTIVALVPEISVGFVGLWNGEGFSSAEAATYAINTILGAVIPSLVELDKQYFPKPTAEFLASWLGVYGMPLTFDILQATITYNSTTERVNLDVPGFGHFDMRPSSISSDQGLVFQIVDPTTDYPSTGCRSQASGGYDGEWMYFTEDASGQQQLMIPGYVYEPFVKMK